MDEYLFIAVAKLKADRLKLEREERAKAPSPDLAEGQPTQSHRRSARTSWFPQKTQWREQS